MNHTSAKKIDGVEAASWIQTLTNGSRLPLRLYFHLPFCKRKCPYCHFYSVAAQEHLMDEMLQALEKEVLTYLPLIQQHTVISCYFGGGTPSLFGAKRIHKILELLKLSQAEITLEVNPETVDQQELETLFHAGVNRLSFGVQSFQPEELKMLGRRHTISDVHDAIEKARTVGYTNISIDLMYDLPHQTKTNWHNTLEQAVQLPITHMSLYNLTIEPNTPFWQQKEKLLPHMPGDLESSKRYQETIHFLQEHGFNQYEISAFSKPNQESLHNVGYWIGEPYLAFGPSASSFYNLIRWANISDIHAYKKAQHEGKIAFDYIDRTKPEERFKELLAVGLRYFPGVHLAQLEKIVQTTLPKETASVIKKLETERLILKNGDLIQLTARGKLLYDTIASELI